MKTKKAAEAIIILGSLTIASFVCPSPCPHIIFGALVVVFGVVLIWSSANKEVVGSSVPCFP